MTRRRRARFLLLVLTVVLCAVAGGCMAMAQAEHPAQIAAESEPPLLRAVAIVGAALVAFLGFAWLALQVGGRIFNPISSHIGQHEDLRRVVLGPLGGGNGPGVLQRLDKLEEAVHSGDTATAKALRDLQATLEGKLRVDPSE